jgi:hypothetical protein
MIDEHELVPFSGFAGDTYKSSQGRGAKPERGEQLISRRPMFPTAIRRLEKGQVAKARLKE